MKLIRLTNTSTGEIMHCAPGSIDAQIHLSIHLAAYGVRAELIDTTAKYGIASFKRLSAAETPPRTPIGDILFGEESRLSVAPAATDKEIAELRHAAAVIGDAVMTEYCHKALAGNPEARRVVAEIIREAGR